MPPRGPAPAISRRMEHHSQGLRCPPQRHHRRDGPGFYEPLPALRHDARRRRRRPGLRRAPQRPDDDRSWSDRLPQYSPGPHGPALSSAPAMSQRRIVSWRASDTRCATTTKSSRSACAKPWSRRRRADRREEREARRLRGRTARARSKFWRSRARAAPRSRARTASAAATGRRRRRSRPRAARSARRATPRRARARRPGARRTRRASSARLTRSRWLRTRRRGRARGACPGPSA